jgi:3-oxoacyl-[acyl-carrier protein] reductase
METGLKGQIVLITGASGGIGTALAQRFAAEGAHLVLHYWKGKERAQRLASQLKSSEILLHRANLSKEVEAHKLVVASVKRFGRIDTLVANAGSWESRDIPLHQMTARQWRQTMDGVLSPTFLVVREFFRVIARQRRGNLTLVGSTAAIFGEAGHADYAAAKAAIAYGLTRSLKNEISRLAPHTRDYRGGRVNCVCPGWTMVPRLESKLGDQKTLRRVLATRALPQLARPEDIANAVVFLSSDVLAGHVTGQILTVAGGMEGRQIWEAEQIAPDLALWGV